MKVTFIKAHPKFAYHAGESGEIPDATIAEYKLLEDGYVREEKPEKGK